MEVKSFPEIRKDPCILHPSEQEVCEDEGIQNNAADVNKLELQHCIPEEIVYHSEENNKESLNSTDDQQNKVMSSPNDAKSDEIAEKSLDKYRQDVVIDVRGNKDALVPNGIENKTEVEILANNIEQSILSLNTEETGKNSIVTNYDLVTSISPEIKTEKDASNPSEDKKDKITFIQTVDNAVVKAVICTDEKDTEGSLILSDCIPSPMISGAPENHNCQAILVKRNRSNNTQTTVNTEFLFEKKATTPIEGRIEKATSTYSGAKNSQENLQSKDYSSEEDWNLPDDSLVEKIVRQVEFYFSDFNLLKNNYLLKDIKKNRDGFVSLKRIATFRRVRLLTRDLRVVVHSLMASKTLEMNAEKTKIRRKEPIPKVRDTSMGKTIIAFNLPLQCPTSEELKDLFSKFGKIVTAEVMTSKSENYNVYHRRCLNRNQDISSKTFGAIEFENYEDAMNALRDEDGYLPKENKMKVVPLTEQIHRSYYRNPRKQHFVPYNRRGGSKFNLRSDFQNSQTNHLSTADDMVRGRPWNGERGYRRYYPRQYPRKFIPTPDVTKNFKNKLSTDSLLRYEKKMSAPTQSRQLKTNNSINLPRDSANGQQSKAHDESSKNMKTRIDA